MGKIKKYRLMSQEQLVKQRDRLIKELTFVDGLLAVPETLVSAFKRRYLYVLACEGGRYYIGQTTNVKRRYKQHESGKGAWFTRAYKPTSIVEQVDLDEISESEAVVLESQLAARYINTYGLDKVRGGKFIQRDTKYFTNELNLYLADIQVEELDDRLRVVL